MNSQEHEVQQHRGDQQPDFADLIPLTDKPLVYYIYKSFLFLHLLQFVFCKTKQKKDVYIVIYVVFENCNCE